MRLSEVRYAAGDPKGAQQPVQRQGYCKEDCAACCKFLILQVNPQYKSKDIRRWIESHGIELKEKDGGLFAYIPIPCTALDGTKCLIYEDRPEVCRTWPQSQAEIETLKDYTNEECTFFF